MHSFTYTCLRQRLQLGQDHVGWLDISMDHALRVDVDLGTDGLPKAPGENLLEKNGMYYITCMFGPFAWTSSMLRRSW